MESVYSRLLIAALVGVALASPAGAGSHLWRFSEFYSSPDKQIQFIEMQEIGGSNSETQIQTHWYATNSYNQSHTEFLGSPLPFGTANKKFLVGTESYAALPGVPAPDYILPDGILEPSGDTVVWWFYQELTIPPSTMPSDGATSLHLVDPAAPTEGFSTGPNSPTNYAGETGTVVLAPPPVQLPATSVWGLLLGGALLALAAWTLLSRRRSRSHPLALPPG
jgi:hypothetical protein